jgi:ketosteroid isomerase-like protein
MKTLRLFLQVFCLFTLASVVAHASESSVDAVLRCDASRLAAMMASDGAALERVFSDAVTFVHSDGRIQGKADYIKNLTAGDTAYADVKTADVQGKQIAEDVIVLIGQQTMRKKLGKDWSDLQLRFMSVWRREKGAWRMVAWQSLRPAGNSVVPGK